MWPERHFHIFDDSASESPPLHCLNTLSDDDLLNPDTPLSSKQLLQALASTVKVQGLGGSSGTSALGTFIMGFLCCATLVLLFWYRVRTVAVSGSKRHQQRSAAEAVSKMDPHDLRDVLGEVGLPAWVSLPDFQRVAWLNSVLVQIWPYFGRMVTTWANDNVTDLLQQSKPPWIRSVKMKHFTLGTLHPEITGVKVYEEGRADEAMLELDFMWAGDQEMSFVVKPVPRAVPDVPLAGPVLDMISNAVVIKAAIERWAVNGRIRLRLRPLLNKVPVVGGVEVALTEMPRFSFDLTVYGGELAVLPGLEAWLHALIQDSVLRPYVLPDRYFIPFAEGAGEGGDRPRGLLDVKVIEARHVPRLDLLTSSDPFLKLFVRSKQKLQTQVRENTTHPRWDEDFKFLVHFPEHQHLTAVMYDYDFFNSSEEIGRFEIPLREIPPNQEIDQWYEIKPSAQDTPASDKYFSRGNPISWVAGGAQKVLGLLTNPWNHKPVKLLKDSKKSTACKLHLKLHYLEFDPEDVDAAASARGPGAAGRRGGGSQAEERMQRMDPAVRNILEGGVLYVRVKKVESLASKPWYKGGWKRKVKVKAELEGTEKWTLPVVGKKDCHAMDQELELIVTGEQANSGGELHLEVWDVHWRDEFKGRLSIPFRRIQRAQMVQDTFDLKEVPQGRICLEVQWMPAFSVG